MKKRVFISVDHGLAVVYFLQSEVVPELIRQGVEVVVLTDDSLVEKIKERFGQPGLIVEGLRIKQAENYYKTHRHTLQFWVTFLRRSGASNKINLEAVTSYVRQVGVEAEDFREVAFPLMLPIVALMQRSKLARRWLVRFQRRFNPGIYADLFEKYQPDLVLASTPGWRIDRYLLREAAARGVPTASVIVGWDNSSSYSLPGADMDWITCWSELQKEELVQGSDWAPEQVLIGGIPSYDGYITGKWLVDRNEYFKQHGLDPERKLIAYASSFITFSPNIQNIRALAELIDEGRLVKSAQLLIRLHPNHFLDVPRFAAERDKVYALAEKYEHVHVVEPVALGGSLGHYSGEDMPEKSSMMAYSDLFVTVYSTMAVEASVHDRPVIALCIDAEEPWQEKFYLPLSEISGWPTHDRFTQSGAGRVAFSKDELCDHLNHYLENPQADLEARRKFIEDECTYTDGSAGRRTAENILIMLEKGHYQ
jgi:hypothetical protein